MKYKPFSKAQRKKGEKGARSLPQCAFYDENEEYNLHEKRKRYAYLQHLNYAW